MVLKRNTPRRKITALTLKYARKYPESLATKRLRARIKLDKRAEHVEKIAEIVISDKKLLNILITGWAKGENSSIDETMQRHLQKSNNIVKHLLELNGSKEKALKQLQVIKKSILEATQQESIKDISAIIKAKKMNEEEKKIFVSDVLHQGDTALSIIIQPIETAIRIIKTQY